MADPLISVITPTWQRNEIVLARCIPSVLAQDYPNVQHVVISDGPDPELAERLEGTFPAEVADGRVVFDELATWDPRYRWGHRARLYGLELAKGDVIAYLDDDNEFRPQHLSALSAWMLERAPRIVSMRIDQPDASSRRSARLTTQG